MEIASSQINGGLVLPDSSRDPASFYDATEQLQKEHYEEIAELYEAHYSDACSQQYRERFIYRPMLEGIQLSGMKVLDAMCGSGQTTEYLLSQDALVSGLDISSEAMRTFRQQWPNCEAVCGSALDSGLESDSFDCITVIGGLHHMHPHVGAAIREAHRVLKPGGYFCFMEPHSGSFPDLIRKYWYKHDRFFSDNEAAIDLKALKAEFSSMFEFKKETYRGNLAFLLVLNSLIFRIPLRLKPIYTPALLSLESLIGKAQGKLLSCFVLAQWQKK
jgi:ubiquinone/menaquinone biosynthesis C-methylase UbiE